MDIGTLGDARQLGFDAIYAEAKEALSHSANELRALTERLREGYAEALQQHDRREREGDFPQASDLASQTSALRRGRQMLSRLELAGRELERSWLFLERGQSVRDAAQAEEPGAEDSHSMAMRILEAQESERLRLADELHDGPAQTLANAVFQVEIIDRQLRTDADAARREVQALRTQLETELEQLRAYINQLRPPMVEEIGLEAALRDTAERLTAETGIPVELTLEPAPAVLDASERMAVLRVAQEALRNVRKHAGATAVTLRTGFQSGSGEAGDGAWVLEVRDDGSGFVPDDAIERTARRHFGLRFMRERAELIGARVEIESAPESGTTVRLILDTGERR